MNLCCFVLQVQQRNLGVAGRIFTIESTRARGGGGRGTVLKLKVNFLPEIITLSKEVLTKSQCLVFFVFLFLFFFDLILELHKGTMKLTILRHAFTGISIIYLLAFMQYVDV